jgi:23S rRNA (cytosine1962-C5)-methyltransferase
VAVAAAATVLAGDAFDALAGLAGAAPFDLLIVDPPAFAKRRAEVERALTAYARLTRLALAVTRPAARS